MFGRQVTLFELMGFQVKMDLSWAFLALLIAWSLAQGFFPALYEGLPVATYWWMGLAGVVGLFFSIVVHEFAHSLVARRYGLPIHGITLFIFGGVAEMEDEPGSAKAEFLMAVAGPITSVLVAIVFYALWAAGAMQGVAEPALAVLRYLAYLNVLLAIFNLVPAFPLDGGRMLRAALWHWMGDLRRATRIAARIGSGFGLILIALGIFSALTGNLIGGIWWFLIGLFLRGVASGSYYQLIARRTLEGQTVRALMADSPVAMPPDITVRAAVDDYVYKYHHDLFPVTRNSRLVGCVTTRRIKEVPREQWDSLSVGEIAADCSDDNTIDADEDAAKALSHMQRTGLSRLMVSEGGRLVGILALRDLLELLSLKMELEED